MTSSQAQSSDRSDPAEGNDAAAGAPAQRVEILGDASPEQVAALMAVISGLGGEEEAPAAPPSRWVDRSRLVRTQVHPGPGGWRASALPR